MKNYLERELSAPVYRFDQVPDPRARNRKHSLRALMLTSLLGLLAGCRKLREVEELTEELGPTGQQYLGGRVPDTTLHDLLEHKKLEVEAFRQQLHAQVKGQARQKRLKPVGVPCGTAAIDGKKMHCLAHDAQGDAQRVSGSEGKKGHWLLRALRAVLTSAAGKPALDQQVIPPDTNEMGFFATFFAGLLATFGALFEIVTVDAGMTSLANAELVEQAQRGYIMALKDNQRELHAEAQRLLLPKTAGAPEAQTPWERHGSHSVQRSLYRSEEIAGAHGWSHLRQVWLVRQCSRDKHGKVTVEDRYFLTNLRSGRLKPAQILLVVRNHWGIENDCFWSLDAQFGEDDHPWVTTGHALPVLGLLRLMAYNLLQWARKRHLRTRWPSGRLADPPSWKSLFRWCWQALRMPLDPSAGPLPAD
jgi:predicted transposase YbfD/YdcC